MPLKYYETISVKICRGIYLYMYVFIECLAHFQNKVYLIYTNLNSDLFVSDGSQRGTFSIYINWR